MRLGLESQEIVEIPGPVPGSDWIICARCTGLFADRDFKDHDATYCDHIRERSQGWNDERGLSEYHPSWFTA